MLQTNSYAWRVANRPALATVFSMGLACASIVTDNAGGVFTHLPWWALQVRSNHEWRVFRELDRRGLWPYLPTIHETVKWSDRTKQTERLLFPGYILAAGDVQAAKQVAGVVSALPSNADPARVAFSEIETLRRLTEQMQFPVTACAYAPGESIRFERGPLAGISGVVVKLRDRVRLVVNVSLFSRRGVAVELDAQSIEAWRPRKQ